MKEKDLDYLGCGFCDFLTCANKHGKRKYRKCKKFREGVKSTLHSRMIRNRYKKIIRKELTSGEL